MKKIPLLLLPIFLLAGYAQGQSFLNQSQILKPAKWSSELATKKAAIGEEVTLIFKAEIQKDWYLYSSDFDPELGPMVTEFEFEPNSSYELVGGIEPVNPQKKYDDIWEGEYTYFKKEGEFRQKVKVLNENFRVDATVNYQVCSDVDGKCIPDSEDFSFTGLEVVAASAEPVPTEQQKDALGVAKTDANPAAPVTKEPEVVEQKPEEMLPQAEKVEEVVAAEGNEAVSQRTDYTADMAQGETTIWGFMVLAFLGGLAAILTPCVFPMIPMTVSFFNKPDQSRAKGISQALFYGLSIIVIYTVIGAIVARLFGPAAANFISTHWLPNLIFFAVFLIFALAFFGMFELVLPSSWVNKMDKQADKGGVMGPFFMAFTLVLVSFSCTGPIVGSILVESAGGAFVKPIAGMFAFSMAFALPFSLFALFPSWMSKLPKSGGWLNTVKVTLGFIELAFAFKFLSVADQVYHWGLLDRHVYIAIWISIALAMGLYFLGYIRLPHDSKVEQISVPRLLLAITSFAFVIYLAPGMFGAPLKGLSGYLPPQTSHDFDLVKVIRENRAMLQASGTTPQSDKKMVAMSNRRHADKFSFPHGIQGYFDYDEGMAAAKRQGKPVFIDFTGHGCVNCRKMEDYVWGESPVLKRLMNDYVVIALYVDDRTPLPKEEWVTSGYDGKVKKTIGQVNADFQITRFQNNAQPFYCLLDHEGELLAAPKAFDLSVGNFVEFLDAGVEEFETRQNEGIAER